MTRLIEAYLPASVSRAGARERYERGRTSHTVLTWWARRPHAAMRALVFASLVDDSPRNRRILDALGAVVPLVDGGPRLLDPFAGGGTIPFEARRIGARVVAADNNELAAMINRTHLVHAPADRTTVEDRVRELGEAVLACVARITTPLFPLRMLRPEDRAPTTYLWTYASTCASCGAPVLLSRRRRLSTKQNLSLEPPAEERCGKCSKVLVRDVRRAEDRMTTVVWSKRGAGKRFTPPSPMAIPDADRVRSIELALLGALGERWPKAELPAWSGIVNPPLYGIRRHADVLTPRQRCVVLSLIGAIREITADVEDRRFYRAVLSGLIDHAVDWNSRLSMWIPENEQVGRALSGPGVPMLWDYAETDPALDGPASFKDKLTRIARGAAALASEAPRGRVVRGPAQSLPIANQSIDAVVTDPPYYDNVYYAALADFVFVWKRLLLEEDEADLFTRETTTTDGELVASRRRFGDEAHQRYVDDLTAAFAEIARVLKPDGVATLVYGHGALRGWTALVEAFAASPLKIAAVHPLAIERAARPRAMNASTADTCLVFVAGRSAGALDEPASDPVHAFAQAAAKLANEELAPAEGWSEALAKVEAKVQVDHPTFTLSRRRSL